MSQTLHQQLVNLRGRAKAWLEGEQDERFYPSYGICDNLRLDEVDFDLLDDLIASWPGGSGSEDYPVLHPSLSPYDAFVYCGPQARWNPEFEYARNRLALLDWLIEQTAHTVQLGEKS